MPILHHLRKKKMGLLRLVCLLAFCSKLFLSLAFGVELKTMNVSMPTNYGTFLGEIHYAQSDLAVALKVERIIKEDLVKAINYFEYVPKDVVHFNIDPYLRLTNGNARGFPTNIINIYNLPASQKDHLISMENWLLGLVFHEYIHITQLDQTRDYLQLGRTLFGTIAKTPVAIVPRWFIEGIAVWGESHLIEGGRLNNPLFNKELLIQYKKNNFCKTLDCLDAPGVYPHGQLAYWAGAHFLEYLENKNPKTIKCLVEGNSSEIPFFLNHVFKNCTGESAQELYAKFREDYLAQNSASLYNKGEWGEKINNVFGSDEYQKGLILDGDILYKAEKERFSEALVSYDLKDDVSLSAKFEFPIVDIASMVEIDSENRFLLVSFNQDPSYRVQNKSWKLINPETLTVERELDLPHDPSYVIHLKGESFLSFTYMDNKWQVFHNENLLYTFSSDFNLTLVKKVGDQLLMKVNDSYGTSFLLLTDVDLKKINVLYKTKEFFDLPIIGTHFALLRNKDQLQIIDWDKTPTVSELPKQLLQQISFAEFNDSRVVVLDDRLKTLTATVGETEKFLRKDASKPTSIELSAFSFNQAPINSFASEHAQNYPRVDHMIPHFWFVALGNSENLFSAGAMTTLVDPMEIYTLNATALLYPSQSKMGGSIDYNQKLIKYSDLWSVSAFINQDYSKLESSETLNLSRDYQLKTSYKMLNNKWTITPSIFLGGSTNDDFISHRVLQNVGMGGRADYQAMSYDDLIQSLKLTLSFQGNSPDAGKTYLATSMAGEFETRFTENFSGLFSSHFSKYFKSDFARGVIFGGGVSDLTKNRTHQFYGLPYGDVFGNTIFNLRTMIDYNFWNIYKGKNFIPFYFKEAHFLMGRESIYADRIYLDGDYLRENMINSFFFGPRVKMNLFYYVPANVDIIFSTIAHPNGKNINQVEFTLMADLF